MRKIFLTLLICSVAVAASAEYLRIRDKDGRVIKTPTPQLWTLADVTNSPFWFDASVASNVTLNTTNVSSIRSMNSALTATQAGGTAQPYYSSNSLNGKNTIKFDGINDVLGNIADSWSSNYTIFAVVQSSSTTNAQGILCKYISGNREIYLAYSATNSVESVFNIAGGSGGTNDKRTYSTGLVGTAWAIIGTVKNGTNLLVSLNGATNTTPQSSGVRFDSAATYSFGGTLLATACLNGSIAEVIYVANETSDEAVQKIEGHLAWKWGLQTNLVPYHPYVGKAPTK